MSSVKRDGVGKELGIISREKPVISLTSKRLTNLVIRNVSWAIYWFVYRKDKKQVS